MSKRELWQLEADRIAHRMALRPNTVCMRKRPWISRKLSNAVICLPISHSSLSCVCLPYHLPSLVSIQLTMPEETAAPTMSSGLRDRPAVIPPIERKSTSMVYKEDDEKRQDGMDEIGHKQFGGRNPRLSPIPPRLHPISPVESSKPSRVNSAQRGHSDKKETGAAISTSPEPPQKSQEDVQSEDAQRSRPVSGRSGRALPNIPAPSSSRGSATQATSASKQSVHQMELDDIPHRETLANRRAQWQAVEKEYMDKLLKAGIMPTWFEDIVLDTLHLADPTNTHMMPVAVFSSLVGSQALNLRLSPSHLRVVVSRTVLSGEDYINYTDVVSQLRAAIMEVYDSGDISESEEWCALYYPRRGFAIHYNKATGQTQLEPPNLRPSSVLPSRPLSLDNVDKALQRVFSIFDRDKTGAIDEVLFALLLQSRILGLLLTQAQVDKVFAELAPPDGDGNVSYSDFAQNARSILSNVLNGDTNGIDWSRLYAAENGVFFFNKRSGQLRAARPAEFLFDDKVCFPQNVINIVRDNGGCVVNENNRIIKA